MISSFRMRLAVLSALMSGLILGAFGVATWWLVRDLKVSQLEQDVRDHAEREVTKSRSVEDWQRLEARIVSGLGVRVGRDLLFLVATADGRTVYRSAHWPERLDAESLPWPMVGTRPRAGRARISGVFDVHAATDRSVGLAPTDRPPQVEAREPLPSGPPPASTALSIRVDGHLWHFGLATTSRNRVAVAVDSEIVDADMRGMRNAFLLCIPFVLVLIGAGAWFLSNQAMRPLGNLMAATQRISAEDLDQRIPFQGEDREFGALIEVFNTMLERLERSFNQAYRFSADAAHELKTPLAILQGQLERAIGMAEAGSPLQSELGSILDEVQRLSTISRKLLILSQADAGRLNLHREPFEVSEALAALAEDVHMLAPHLNVSCQIQPGLSFQADRSLFPQVLHNLISNAIKYNISDGWIHIAAGLAASGIVVTVANSSPGIPFHEQARLFERFFRADGAHGRKIDGVGLGLSLSREIARAHGGDLTFVAEEDGSVLFKLLLVVEPTGGFSANALGS